MEFLVELDVTSTGLFSRCAWFLFPVLLCCVCCVALRCVALRCVAIRCVTVVLYLLSCVSLCCVAVCCVALLISSAFLVFRLW